MGTEDSGPGFKEARGPAHLTLDRQRLADAVLVVAHPDDEILWFSSVVAQVRRIIIVFTDDPRVPDLGRKRERLFAAYPLKTAKFLGFTESCSFNCAPWPNVQLGQYGLALKAPRSVLDAYRLNYERLITSLDGLLADSSLVLTHGPWGEYGHEEHVQVHAAVSAIQRKRGFQLWFPGYVSDRSWPLMLDSVVGFSHQYATMDTNRDLAHELAALYREHDCWTWYDDYVWPTHEPSSQT
jgi:LmbE family N-acetylglucosaminyl deacetylase